MIPIFPRSVLNWVATPLDQYFSKGLIMQLLLLGFQNLLWFHPKLLLIYKYIVIKIQNMFGVGNILLKQTDMKYIMHMQMWG